MRTYVQKRFVKNEIWPLEFSSSAVSPGGVVEAPETWSMMETNNDYKYAMLNIVWYYIRWVDP